jgi:CheY-like chemotaxis protein
VLTAKSGREALDIFQKRVGQVDLVILDMIMPDMDGGETFDKLKGIDPNIKILLSSGYSINGRAQEILSRGCHGFIQKPFNLQELSLKLREAMEIK